MRIGIFGGSFNPPHLGHMHLAESIRTSLNLDEVWLIPSKISPHRSMDEYAAEEERLAMCELAASEYPWMRVEDYELKQDRISYTYYTVKHFVESRPDDTFFLLVGSDMFLSFDTWYHWQDILQYVTLVGMARKDGEIKNLQRFAKTLGQYGEICVVNVDSFAVSSTKIRSMIRKSQNYSCYLPKKIVQYIEEQNLYSGSGKMYHIKERTAFLERCLTKKRFQHSCNVARAAKILAQQYGADIEKAYFAGLVHDICKEIPYEEQYALMTAGNFAPDEAELHSRKLWHGIAGAYFIQTEFGIQDEDILNAVRFHTVGRAGMSLLEEIIYMADMISEERDYKGVGKMRRLATENLQVAMLEALTDAIGSVLKKGVLLPHYTIEAYNSYMLRLGKLPEPKKGSSLE
ncbi:MAG: nicotinate (nicotinamide) nucleotide adenylyltransferase [Oscillospiraceae bacterium]